LIPFWTKGKPGKQPINAMSETVASKPMFRDPFKRRRCLVGPNDLLRPIHDRMPVILDPAHYDRWLDRDVPGAAVADLLRPAPNDWLETWPTRDMDNDPETNRGYRPDTPNP